MASGVGSKNVYAKLCDEQVVRLRQLHLEGVRPAVLAKQFGVSQATISKVVNRKAYSNV